MSPESQMNTEPFPQLFLFYYKKVIKSIDIEIQPPDISPPVLLLSVHFLEYPIFLSISTLSWAPCLLFIYFLLFYFSPFSIACKEENNVERKKKSLRNVDLASASLTLNPELEFIQLLCFTK